MTVFATVGGWGLWVGEESHRRSAEHAWWLCGIWHMAGLIAWNGMEFFGKTGFSRVRVRVKGLEGVSMID